MGALTDSQDVALPSNPIRVETALSRYPVHRLAKHGEVAINIRERVKEGEVSIKWEVTHNSKYGQPGPLAYRLDTLLINRKIEEASRPVPRVLRLGSYREIISHIGLKNHDTDKIKRSLRQNAFAAITAKINYRLNNGGKRTLEADFTRYSVVFTGEELSDGRKADAVYIILNDIYMQVINGAMTRPLDYDYLKSLPPAPQRFYELLSYQMYAAIKNDRDRAKLPYSELCRYAPLTRHVRWELVRKQLAKIHAPHRKSGYIAKIDFQATTDAEGQPDWTMLYQPGPKARAEYRAFAKRGGPSVLEMEPLNDTPTALPLIDRPDTSSPLAAELIERGVSPAMAADLVEQQDANLIRAQMDQLDWRLEHRPGKIDDPAAWLVKGIRKGGYVPPKGYKPKADREREAVESRQRVQKEAETQQRVRTQEQREREEKALILDYWERLGPEERAELQAEADAAPDAQPVPGDGPLRRMGQSMNRHTLIRKLLEQAGRLPLPE